MFNAVNAPVKGPYGQRVSFRLFRKLVTVAKFVNSVPPGD